MNELRAEYADVLKFILIWESISEKAILFLNTLALHVFTLLQHNVFQTIDTFKRIV